MGSRYTLHLSSDLMALHVRAHPDIYVLNVLLHMYFGFARDAPSREAAQGVVQQIIRANVQHVSAEDRSLYPAFGRVIPKEAGAEAMQTHGQLVDMVSPG